MKDVNTVFTFEENADQGAKFGLVMKDLTQIKPNYETVGKSNVVRFTEDGYNQGN